MTITEFQDLQTKTPFEQKKRFIEGLPTISTHFWNGNAYFYSVKKPMWSENAQKLFLKTITNYGLSIDKKFISQDLLNSLKGKNVEVRDKVFEIFKLNWLDSRYTSRMTKGLWIKIFQGKVTNNTQVQDYISKYVFKFKEPDKGLCRKAVDNLISLGYYAYLPLTCSVKDLALVELNRQDYNTQLLRDISNECFILNIKFNPNWSLKRLQEFHQENIKVMLESEIEFLENITFPIQVEVPKGFTFINDLKSLLIEGKTMNHCVFHSYQNSIKKGEYCVIHCDTYNCTIGIRMGYKNGEYGYWSIDQIRGYSNQSVEQTELIKSELIETLETLNKNFKPTKKQIEEVDLAF